MFHCIECIAAQPPFAYGIDTEGRAMFSINFNILSDGIPTQYPDDVLTYLAGLSLAQPAVNSFVGLQTTIPTGAGPFALFVPTAGYPTLETQSSDETKNVYVGLQIIVRGSPFLAASNRASAIWSALDGVRNRNIPSE